MQSRGKVLSSPRETKGASKQKEIGNRFLDFCTLVLMVVKERAIILLDLFTAQLSETRLCTLPL